MAYFVEIVILITIFYLAFQMRIKEPEISQVVLGIRHFLGANSKFSNHGFKFSSRFKIFSLTYYGGLLGKSFCINIIVEICKRFQIRVKMKTRGKKAISWFQFHGTLSSPLLVTNLIEMTTKHGVSWAKIFLHSTYMLACLLHIIMIL